MTKNCRTIQDKCRRLYEDRGLQAVMDYVDGLKRKIKNEYCIACERSMPQIKHECLICGQTTKPTFKVKTRFVFEGEFEVVAKDGIEAKEMVEKHCGLVLGRNIHTSLPDAIIPDWDFTVHPDRKIVSVKKV